MRGDSALLEIASSVADGEAVDWSAVQALATDERERALIARLKIIASIGDVHRSTDDADAPPADGASTLDVRGRVVGHIRPAVSAAGRRVRCRPEAAEDGDPAAGGARWGRLLLQERVGAGVYGEVFRAFDESLRRDVAREAPARERAIRRAARRQGPERRPAPGARPPPQRGHRARRRHARRPRRPVDGVRSAATRSKQLLERQGRFGAREAALLGQDLCRALAAVHARRPASIATSRRRTSCARTAAASC